MHPLVLILVFGLVGCSSSATNDDPAGAAGQGGSAGAGGSGGVAGAQPDSSAGNGGSGGVSPPVGGPLAVGSNHACAAFQDGLLQCWGAGSEGQLGAGPGVTESFCPTPVNGALEAALVAAGAFHTCAATNSAVSCWGADDKGQLGDGSGDAGSAPNQNRPVPVVNLAQATRLSAGLDHSCAISDGLWCWGDNGNSAVGVPSPSLVPSPVAVSIGGEQAVEVALGFDSSCAASAEGSLFCWGSNTHLQLAASAPDPISSPLNVSSFHTELADTVQLSAGARHACAIRNDNTLWCWGNNEYAELGRGWVGGMYSVPEQVTELGNQVQRVAAGGNHTCASKLDGTMWCWGANEYGQIGNAEYGDSSVDSAVMIPTPVIGLAGNVTEIGAGASHTCARLDSGAVYCWGNNGSGQVGVDQVGAPRFATPQLVSCT